MAFVRQVPRCSICGKVIAKAIRKDYSNYPPEKIPYGDNFIRWEYFEHRCSGKLELSEKAKEVLDKYMGE